VLQELMAILIQNGYGLSSNLCQKAHAHNTLHFRQCVLSACVDVPLG
jgi:hypothetical protein